MNINKRAFVWRALLSICLPVYLVFLYYAPSFGVWIFLWSTLGAIASMDVFYCYILEKDIRLGMATFKVGNRIGRLFALVMFSSIFIASIAILYEK